MFVENRERRWFADKDNVSIAEIEDFEGNIVAVQMIGITILS